MRRRFRERGRRRSPARRAAERRRRLGGWLETLQQIESVKPRTPEEREAKEAAIERMMESRPIHPTCA